MVVGMATKKVTVTIDEDQLDRSRALVKAGTTSSVSGFVRHAVAVALDDIAGWGRHARRCSHRYRWGAVARGKAVG
jgi:Arc/MetJ-type ribon-helix-helix transcriptional regulator